MILRRHDDGREVSNIMATGNMMADQHALLQGTPAATLGSGGRKKRHDVIGCGVLWHAIAWHEGGSIVAKDTYIWIVAIKYDYSVITTSE